MRNYLLPREIIAHVARSFKLTYEDITGEERWALLVAARCTISSILRGRGMSFPQIGRMLNKHHTSVLHYVRATEDRYLKHKVYGPAVRAMLDWHAFGEVQTPEKERALAEAIKRFKAEDEACKPVLQKVEVKLQQPRSTKVLHPEATEKHIATALKAEKLHGVEILWNGDIVVKGQPAVFDVYVGEDKTDLTVRDEGRLYLYKHSDRVRHELGSATTYAQLAALVRSAVIGETV